MLDGGSPLVIKGIMLLLVHIEEQFRSRLSDEYLARVRQACKRADYVVHASSNFGYDLYVPELEGVIDETIDWAWGYEPEAFDYDEDEKKWVIPTVNSMHEFTWVPPLFRRPFNRYLAVGGGCDGECLADMLSVLQHQNISYRLRRPLVYS